MKTQWIALTAIVLFTHSAFAREHFGHCRTFYREEERDSQADLNTKDRLRAELGDAQREHGRITDQYNRVKADFDQSSALHQTEVNAYEDFKSKSGAQFREAKGLEKTYAAESDALSDARLLLEIIETLQTIESDEFIAGLGADMRTIDFRVELKVPETCPAYARAHADRCELVMSWMRLLSQELDQLSKNGLDPQKLLSLSPTLRLQMALARESMGELREIGFEVGAMIQKRETAIAQIMKRQENISAIMKELSVRESALRSSLVNFDRAKTLFQQLDAELKASQNNVNSRQGAYDGFKVGKEKYRVAYQGGVDC